VICGKQYFAMNVLLNLPAFYRKELEFSPDFLGRKGDAFYAPVRLIDKKDGTNLPLFVGYFSGTNLPLFVGYFSGTNLPLFVGYFSGTNLPLFVGYFKYRCFYLGFFKIKGYKI
jgi:hypothetical protein